MKRSEDVQTCPDRNSMPGPWKFGENLDRWETDRWSRNVLLIRIKHFFTILFNRIKNRGRQTLFMGSHNDEWLWKWGPPRTCSFCGGIHPEDAIRLVSEGWEVETTFGKSYKRYLEAPGYKAHIEKMSEIARTTRDFSMLPDYWSPVPPVKVYVAHFSQDQVDRFNKELSHE